MALLALASVSGCNSDSGSRGREGGRTAGADRESASFEGYWDEGRADEILGKTLRLRLAPDLSGLGEAERTTLAKLTEVGEIFHGLYEISLHHQSHDAARELRELHDRGVDPERTGKLSDLLRVFRGPIATTLENERVPFLPVDEEVPGKNVYPIGATRAEIDRFLQAHPDEREAILHPRTVVRRTEASGLARDLRTLRTHPVLDALHPGLEEELRGLSEGDSPAELYAVPYSVAWADEIVRAHRLLWEAAVAISAEDPDFASYLRHRARDLLADDYEAGDAAWVTGRFRRLNAQIGSYETYDDELYGVKSFFSLSILLRDEERSRALETAIRGIQAVEDSLPYEGHKRIREDIPVGVYDVVADFGQARGTNTATILPNESDHARKYGRIVLLRGNILRNPALLALARAAFGAVFAPEHVDDLGAEARLQRTIWHEIGHYLGPSRTRDGRDLGVALQRYSDLLEEMKADLVSSHAARVLGDAGHLDDAELRAIYAAGALRTLQPVKPRREQPYGTMQLMQMNYFLDRGLLTLEDGRLRIDYSIYPDVVRDLLGQVISLQLAGDPEAAAAFVERWGSWEEGLHGALAARIREAARHRFRLVTYAALGE